MTIPPKPFAPCCCRDSAYCASRATMPSRFLQGQFTNDVRLLADGRTQVAACCTNQGRVIATRPPASDGRSDLRAAAGGPARQGGDAPAQVRAARQGGVTAGCGPAGGRAAHGRCRNRLCRSPRFRSSRADDVAGAALGLDRGRHIPVRTRTRGGCGAAGRVAFDQRTFVQSHGPARRSQSGSQRTSRPDCRTCSRRLRNSSRRRCSTSTCSMAVSFTKGCYTGQEIVARTHHLGRVKRRTMRFHIAAGRHAARRRCRICCSTARRPPTC